MSSDLSNHLVDTVSNPLLNQPESDIGLLRSEEGKNKSADRKIGEFVLAVFETIALIIANICTLFTINAIPGVRGEYSRIYKVFFGEEAKEVVKEQTQQDVSSEAASVTPPKVDHKSSPENSDAGDGD